MTPPSFDINSFIDEIVDKFGIKKSDIWKKQFYELSCWLKPYNLKVILEKDCDDIVDWDLGVVKINSNPKWESRYYSLLHECGHIIISENPENFEYNYPYYIYEKDERRSKTDAYRVSLVGEEIEAWKLGRNLGDNILNHFINHEKFDKMMTECVMSYVYWVTEE